MICRTLRIGGKTQQTDSMAIYYVFKRDSELLNLSVKNIFL